jgi:hypothetical protein
MALIKKSKTFSAAVCIHSEQLMQWDEVGHGASLTSDSPQTPLSRLDAQCCYVGLNLWN